MTLGDAVVIAQEMIARLGAKAAAEMEQNAADHDAVGDREGATFWRRAALAARLLAGTHDEAPGMAPD